MTGEKGKKDANVITEGALSDKISGKPKLDQGVQSRIGDQLRAMYDDLMHQPVPDKLKSLLDQLDQTAVRKAR